VPASKQSTKLYDTYYKLYAQSWSPDDGCKDHLKHVEREFHLVPAFKQSTNLYDIHLKLYVQSLAPDDGQKDHLKHVE